MTAFGVLKYGFMAFAAIGSAVVGVSLMTTRRLNALAGFFAASIVAGLVFFADIFWIEPNWIDVNRVGIQDAALAQVLGDTKIVHISDLHLTEGIGYREKQLIAKVNRLNPDLIFITGDFIDSEDQVLPAVTLLRQLHASTGIYGVPGNTDHIVMKSEELRKAMSPSGIEILINENRRIRLPNGRMLHLIGTDDPKYGYDKIGKALKTVPLQAPSILLAHNPDIFEEAVRERINLVLAGDTHGGQVGIPMLVKMSDYANRTPYMKGLFREKGTQMYVNRGIGTKTLPIRFLCRPEIAVIEVEE